MFLIQPISNKWTVDFQLSKAMWLPHLPFLTQLIEQAKTAVKNDILGEGVPENLNTLKEIAEKIAAMSGDTEGAVVQKLADLGRRIDEFANLDLVATYNAAKA